MADPGPSADMADTGAFLQAPAELRQLMAQVGPIWGRDVRRHSALVKDAFRPLLAMAPKSGVEVVRDVAYGGHRRQRLDVFRPATFTRTADPAADPDEAAHPVIVFVHGGAFIRGDKRVDEELYDNVLYWFARQGFVGVNVEYRLAPEAAYPGGADDLAAAVNWLRQNVRRHGGDPSRLFLVGHSAGGTHVASYAYDPALPYLGRHATAIVLISARVRADVLAENPNAEGVRAYFGEAEEFHDRRSPVVHCGNSSVPAFVVIAEHENPLLDVYGLEMAYRIGLAHRKAPRFLRMTGHNHMSIMAHFNTGDEFLGREIIDFCRSVAK